MVVFMFGLGSVPYCFLWCFIVLVLNHNFFLLCHQLLCLLVSLDFLILAAGGLPVRPNRLNFKPLTPTGSAKLTKNKTRWWLVKDQSGLLQLLTINCKSDGLDQFKQAEDEMVVHPPSS